MLADSKLPSGTGLCIVNLALQVTSQPPELPGARLADIIRSRAGFPQMVLGSITEQWASCVLPKPCPQLRELEEGRNGHFHPHFCTCSEGVGRTVSRGVGQRKTVGNRSWEWLLSSPRPLFGKGLCETGTRLL